MTAKQKVYALADKYGCEVSVWPTGRIELHAPPGKVFSGLDSHAISSGGSTFGNDGLDWKGALAFFAGEVTEGFDDDTDE